MNIIISENKNRMLSCNFVIPIGQNSVCNGFSGFAHLIEHLIFHGHPEYSQYNLLSCIEGLGGLVNGMTEDGYTVIFVRIDEKYVLEVLELIYSAIKCFEISDAAFEAEKTIVDNEEKYQIPWYEGKRELTQKTRRINSLEELKEIYHNWYLTENWTLLMMGEMSEETSKTIMHKYSSPCNEKHTGNNGKRIRYYDKPLFWTKTNCNQNQFYYYYPCSFKKKYIYKILKYIYAVGLKSYLYNDLVAENGYTYSLGFAYQGGNKGYFVISGDYYEVSESQIKEMVEPYFDTQFVSNMVSDSQINRAIQMTISELKLKSENVSSVVNDYIEAIVLEEKFDSYNKQIEELEKLDCNSVRNILETTFDRKVQ